MKKIYALCAILFLGLVSTITAQKGKIDPKNPPIFSNSANCTLTVSIDDRTPGVVCSELVKSLVAITPACVDTTVATYRWSSSVGGVFSTSRTADFNLPKFLVATSVTFTVWVKNGTDSLSADIIFVVKPRPSRPTISPVGTIILCNNNAVILNASGCTGSSVTSWSNGANGVNSISVPAIGGTYFKVACEKNGCVSDSTAAAALITGIATPPPTVTNKTICEGTTITAGNGLQAQHASCGGDATGTYVYTGGTVGYDQGYRSTNAVDPSVVVPNSGATIKKISVSITWRKQKGGFQNSCGVGDTENWPFHTETQFRIKSPSGRIITLVNTNTYGGANNPQVTTVFEDGANPVIFYNPPVSGTFASAEPLSGFIGENASGTWTLLPYDAVWKDPLCVSGFSISFTATNTNGTLTWWDAPTGGSQVGTGSEYIPINTTAGTYTYYAQGQCNQGCPSTRTAATLTILPTPIAPTADVNVPLLNGTRGICGGESITLTATGCNNGNTIKWTDQSNTNIGTGSPLIITPTFSNYSNITYTYKAICEGINGCRSINSNVLNVTVKYKPLKPIVSGPGNSVCTNASVSLSYSGCSGTLGWTGNRTGSSINFILIGNVNIKAACTTNGCTSDSSDVYSITALPKPGNVTINSSSVQALCRGESVTLSANGCTPAQVRWTGGFSGSPITITPTSSRNFRASCLGINGCAGDSSSALTIMVLPKTKPLITGQASVCGTQSITLTATGCSGASETVMWQNGDTGTTFNATIAQTQTFRAVCIRNGTCVSDSSDVFTVNYYAKPATPTIITPNNSTICQGSSITLTASGCANGTTYKWTGGLSGSSISVSPSTTKSYKVACNLNNVCSSDSSSATTITVLPTPIFSVNANKTSLCTGESATLTATGCTGALSWTGGTTTTAINVSPTVSTTYTATCTTGSCSFSQQIVITVLSTPSVTTSGVLQCNGQPTTLTANNIPSGSTIQWRKDGVDIVGATGTTYSTSVVGSYDFTSYKLTNVNTSVIGGGSYPNTVIYFTDKNIGFVGNGDGIFKTGDGGITWTRVYNSASKTVNSIYMNSLNGWAVGEQGLAIKTIDGGNTWTNASISTSFPLKKVSFKDSNNGVIVGDFGSIYYTTNAGNTWATVNTFNGGNYPTFLSLSFVPNTTNVWAVGFKASSVFMAKSTDNGITWLENSLNISQIPANTFLNNITFTSANNGLIVGSNSTIFKTSNGGTNWQLQTSSISSNFKDIQFVNGQIGYICGSFPTGSLLKTTDGGNNWKSLNMSAYPVSLSFVDENTGWLTNYGSVLQYIAPQCSTIPTILSTPQRPNAPSITPITNSTICQGSSITLSATGCAGGTYAWTGGLTGSSVTVSPTATKNYKVACTVGVCVSDSSAVVTITVFGSMYSIVSGNWDDASTWSCGREPLLSDNVTINVGNVVTIRNANAKAKKMLNNGQVSFLNSTSRLTFGNGAIQTITYTSQPGPVDGKDGEVNSYLPNTPNPDVLYTNIYAWTISGVENIKRCFFGYDLSSIPTNAVVDSAFFSLYFSQAFVDGPQGAYHSGHTALIGDNAFFINRVTGNWTESGVTWNNKPTFSTTNQVSIAPFTNYRQDYTKMNVKNLVADMVANPTSSYGFMLRYQVEAVYKITIFATSDDPNPAVRPKLQVYYHLP